MITYDMIVEAQEFLVKEWGEDGKRVIEACAKVTPYNGKSQTFISQECSACGGNWGGMLLSGIKALYPEVWDRIPEQMGVFAFSLICNTLVLCGVDTSE